MPGMETPTVSSLSDMRYLCSPGTSLFPLRAFRMHISLFGGKMDHHCLWLNTCIGYANHKSFLLFLVYATALSGLVAEETGYVIYKWLDGGQVVVS